MFKEIKKFFKFTLLCELGGGGSTAVQAPPPPPELPPPPVVAPEPTPLPIFQEQWVVRQLTRLYQRVNSLRTATVLQDLITRPIQVTIYLRIRQDPQLNKPSITQGQEQVTRTI